VHTPTRCADFFLLLVRDEQVIANASSVHFRLGPSLLYGVLGGPLFIELLSHGSIKESFSVGRRLARDDPPFSTSIEAPLPSFSFAIPSRLSPPSAHCLWCAPKTLVSSTEDVCLTARAGLPGLGCPAAVRFLLRSESDLKARRR